MKRDERPWNHRVFFECAVGTRIDCGHHNITTTYQRHADLAREHRYCGQMCVEHGLFNCTACKGKPGRCLGAG